MKEIYQLTVKKDMTCAAGSKIVEMFATLENGTAIPAKFFIGKEKKNGKYPIYIDEVSADGSNMVAKIISVQNKKGEAMDDTDIEIIEGGKYQIALTKLDEDNKTMHGEIVVTTGDEASAKSTTDLDDECKALIESKIKEGIITKEEMDARMKVFEENNVDPFLLKRIIAGYRKYEKPTHKPSCIFVDPYMESSAARREEGIIAEGLRAAVGRTAIICEGEKSVGKNVYMETIAWLMGMPLRLITMSRNMAPSSIYGEKTTDNSASERLNSASARKLAEGRLMVMNGHSDRMNDAAEFELLKARAASVNIVIDQSELYDWLEDGGVLVFNEMNMCEANFFASFTNQLLDGTGFLFIPGRGEVAINPDCVLFGTQNADYQGVETQNEATMSRFGCLYFRQPEKIKGQLIAAVDSALKRDGFENVKVNRTIFKEAEEFYKKCRAAVQKGIVSNACLNIRGFVRAITAVAESEGFAKLKRQVEIHVINTCPIDEREALYAMADVIITK